jgi:hypothetical protein
MGNADVDECLRNVGAASLMRRISAQNGRRVRSLGRSLRSVGLGYA